MSRLLTLQEIAAYLQLHEMTLYRLAKAGKIPPMKKVGGRWRCDQSELESWFSAKEAK